MVPHPVSSMLRGLECSLYPRLLAPGAGQEDRTQALPSAGGGGEGLPVPPHPTPGPPLINVLINAVCRSAFLGPA